MAYLPKSKVTIKTTGPGFLVYKITQTPFTGDYMETNKGKYFEGTNNVNPGEELVLDTRRNDEETNISFGINIDVKRYNVIRKNVKRFLEKVNNIPVVKNTPTEEDYTRGFFRRYFSKRINGVGYKEIDKDTFESISKKDGKYDHNLYEIGLIRWNITGNVFKTNSDEIKKTERRFKNIFSLFPILNEFLRPSLRVQENLYTSGGELYYIDGTEYIGDYHIHPEKGPMVGAIHSSFPHPLLYYTNQLPSPSDTTYQDFLTNYNKLTCYKCIRKPSGIEGVKYEIAEIKISRILGCPAGTYQDPDGYDKAVQGCTQEPNNTLDLTYGDRPPIGSEEEYAEGEFIGTTFPNPPGGFGEGEGGSLGNFGSGGATGGMGGGGSSGYGGGSSGGGFGGGSGGGGGGTGGASGGSGGGGGGYAGFTCFTANTLITMADGSKKPISSVQVGEKVKSEIGESTVLEIQIHDEGDYEVYSINGGKPFVTEEHPFKTIDGWKAINPFTTLEKHQISSDVLDINDILYKLGENELVESITKGNIKYPKVYNLSLDNEHVYYANGYLVHNNKGAGEADDSISDNPDDYNFNLGDGSTSYYQ